MHAPFRFLAGILAATLVLIGTAFAATTPNSIVTAQTIRRGIVQFLQGTDVAGTYKTLYTAGANGSKCFGMVETNNDASATHVVTVQVFNATVGYGGTAIITASNDGYVNTAPPKAMMTPAVWPGLPIDSNGNPFIYLVSGDTLQATFATAITSMDWVNIYVNCVDF
jgi:hypothetical protein